ncbi:hypothetical protein OMP44_09050 [Pseudomonas sp. CBMAI 2609]|uniref:ComF family protein n=1 Tax=Pseudomonas flavocrustae TaxID=2991719 RepID=A0ABT6IF44_9PSED|nr:hypothetical protein [Pseudomonas sp. CBMAI 2609]MDH4763043.1 hypothetical protein [Pseudomonas sp. CBMAI 2609]
MIKINPMEIKGNWVYGEALDFHTTSSTHMGQNEYGHDVWDTIRPPIAELLYQLKYKNNREALNQIVTTAANHLKRSNAIFDCIVPVPSSANRAFPPALEIAKGIGRILGIDVNDCIEKTRQSSELKGVTDPDERQRLLSGLYKVEENTLEDLKVLLIDDLYRSGSTMSHITDVLYQQGQAKSVFTLAITKTRTNR